MRLPQSFDLWIVDDDPSSREIVQQALANEASARIVYIQSPLHLEERLARESPGCIVTDLLDTGGGLSLIRRVHELAWPAPAILMCREARPTAIVQAMRAGVSSVVEKPLNVDEIRRELLLAIDRGTMLVEHLRRQAAARQSLASLPDRYQSTLEEIIQCRPQKLIAGRLNIALRTVKKRKQEIFEHLGVETYAELLSLVHLAHEGCRGWHVGRSSVQNGSDPPCTTKAPPQPVPFRMPLARPTIDDPAHG